MRLRLPLAFCGLFTLACVCGGPVAETEPVAVPPRPDTGPTEDTSDTSDTSDTNDPSGLVVDVVPAGDLGCFTGALETPTVGEPSVDTTVDVRVEDWETGDGVDTPELTFWEGGTEIGTATGDADGEVGKLGLPTCTPLLVEASTDPALDETKPTFSARMLSPDDDEWVVSSLASVTYTIIPSLLGVSLDPDKGIIFGRVHDCAGAPLDHIEVRFSEGGETFYFGSSWPNRDQQWTSEDGWFVVLNAPPAEGTLRAWAWDGSTHVEVAEADVTSVADGGRVANLLAGVSGELLPPEACQ